MSVLNFELDITSRVAADGAGGEAPSGLVWQPTLTLWQPGRPAAIVIDSPAARTDSPAATGTALEQALASGPTTTANPATLTRPSKSPVPTNAHGQVRSGQCEVWRGDGSPAQTLGCYSLFFALTTAILAHLPWEELARLGVFSVGFFAALVALHLGGSLILLRALWRATLRYALEGGAAFWCGLARGAALVMLIATAHMAILTCAPRLVELTNIATGAIPMDNYQLRLMRGGTELAVDGAIGVGLSKKVALALDRNPLVQALQLNSNGGSARESRKLRDLIAARKLSTTTSQGCYGECTLAYMAGAPRRIGEQASLRFYRSAQPGMPKWALWRDYEHDRRDWLARGVPAVFAEQALTVRDAAGWQPSLSELIAANIVSPSLATVEPQAGDNGQDTLTLLERELRRAPFFTLLKELEPEGYRKLVGEIHVGLHSSGSTENIQLRIHPMAKAVSYARLAHADDAILLEYAEMILEQISLLYSESALVCNRYFGMDLSGAALDTAKYFSEEMLAKETGLMADLLRSSAAREYQPPARQTIKARWDKILALIGKRYGAKAVLFFETRQASRDPGQTCHVLYEFYKAVSRLPAREAGPLLRYHFAQLQARSLPQTTPAHPAKQVTSLVSRAANRRAAH